jgi:hypothetical protein
MEDVMISGEDEPLVLMALALASAAIRAQPEEWRAAGEGQANKMERLLRDLAPPLKVDHLLLAARAYLEHRDVVTEDGEWILGPRDQ